MPVPPPSWGGAGASVVVVGGSVGGGTVVGGRVTGGGEVVAGAVGGGVVTVGDVGVVAGAVDGAVGGSVSAGAVPGSVVVTRPVRFGRVVEVVVVRRVWAGGPVGVSVATTEVSGSAAGACVAGAAAAVVPGAAVVAVVGAVAAVVVVAGFVVGATLVVETVLTSTDGVGLGWLWPPDDGTRQRRASTPSATISPAMISRATRRRLRGRSVRSSYSSSSITLPSKVAPRWPRRMGL